MIMLHPGARIGAYHPSKLRDLYQICNQLGVPLVGNGDGRAFGIGNIFSNQWQNKFENKDRVNSIKLGE